MDKEDHKTDVFIKKIVKETGLESPSLDFTTKVLAKVNVKNRASTVTTYRPLISKSYLLALAVVMACILSVF